MEFRTGIQKDREWRTLTKKKEMFSWNRDPAVRRTAAVLIWFRRCEVDCHVLLWEGVTAEDGEGRRSLEVRKMKRMMADQRSKWWKMKNEESCEVFKEELKQIRRFFKIQLIQVSRLW